MRAPLEVSADAPLVTRKQVPRNLVEIKAFAYAPQTLSVKGGATIRWRNDDSAKHTVSARSGAFTSRELPQGAVYARTFTKAGTFVYVCAVHPRMSGRVLVH